jgi:hypothetical protein
VYAIANDGKFVHGVKWCENSAPYPLQTILRKVEIAPIAAPQPFQTVEEAFPTGDKVFIIAGLYYGSIADIVDTSEVAKTGRIKVLVSLEDEPVITPPAKIAIEQYLPARIAANRCGEGYYGI